MTANDEVGIGKEFYQQISRYIPHTFSFYLLVTKLVNVHIFLHKPIYLGDTATIEVHNLNHIEYR